MNVQVEAEEIKRAAKIHDYIKSLEKLTNLSLRASPILLGAPSKQIIFDIPVYSKHSYEYVEQLYQEFSEHNCLFKAMRTGWQHINSNHKIIPNNKEEYFQQLSNSHVFHVAKNYGYSVPSKFLQEKQFCYGQYEAYYAVHEMFYGNAFAGYSKYFNYYNNTDTSTKWYEKIKLIATQFIVPGSESEYKTPYIFDQLWVVSNVPNRVRLLGLEIAGEHHFLNEGKSKTLGKEKYLKELGYEMYYVASWWCRVDPYRVICEFLQAAGLVPDATSYLIGSELKTIDDYRCGICHAPMVRWHWDWIQECQVGGSTVFAHKSCATHQRLK